MYNWYDLLINYFLESVKESVSGVKKVIKFFETKIYENVDNNMRKGYKPENTAVASDDQVRKCR